MKKNESGRSMVEMLGVLAIIGVLSVGGIAGYRMAMEKHKLNTFMNNAAIIVAEAKAYLLQNPKIIEEFIEFSPYYYYDLPISLTDSGVTYQASLYSTYYNDGDPLYVFIRFDGSDYGEICNLLKNTPADDFYAGPYVGDYPYTNDNPDEFVSACKSQASGILFYAE